MLLYSNFGTPCFEILFVNESLALKARSILLALNLTMSIVSYCRGISHVGIIKRMLEAGQYFERHVIYLMFKSCYRC